MAFNPIRLARVSSSTSATTIYTATGNVIVKQLVVANGSGAAITANVQIGGILVLNAPIQPNSTTILDLSQVIVSTDTIVASSTTAGLGIHVSGVTF